MVVCRKPTAPRSTRNYVNTCYLLYTYILHTTVNCNGATTQAPITIHKD